MSVNIKYCTMENILLFYFTKEFNEEEGKI